MNIALKEANETLYWVELLRETGLLECQIADELGQSVTELIRILAAIVRTTQRVKEDQEHYQVLRSSIN